MISYEDGENPMVLPRYDNKYDEEEENKKWAYLEDVGYEDTKDKSLGL